MPTHNLSPAHVSGARKGSDKQLAATATAVVADADDVLFVITGREVISFVPDGSGDSITLKSHPDSKFNRGGVVGEDHVYASANGRPVIVADAPSDGFADPSTGEVQVIVSGSGVFSVWRT